MNKNPWEILGLVVGYSVWKCWCVWLTCTVSNRRSNVALIGHWNTTNLCYNTVHTWTLHVDCPAPSIFFHFFWLAKCTKIKALYTKSLRNLKPILMLLHFSFLPVSPFTPLFVFKLILQDGGVAAPFSCDVKSTSALLKWFLFLLFLSLHLLHTLPSLLQFFINSPSSRCPTSIPFTLCPLPSYLSSSVFIFSWVTQSFHPSSLFSFFPPFDHHSHC